MKKHLVCIIVFCLFPKIISAQKLSVSTNILDWANLATINTQVSYAVSQHFDINSGFRYNNWNFALNGNPFQNRARTAYAGVRYWPWNVYSGYWFDFRLQAEEYNRGGLPTMDYTEEGDALGCGVGLGYSRMLSHHLNLDFGIGLWAGRTRYTRYACPRCGRITDRGKRFFCLTDDNVKVALVYIF